MRNCIIQLLGGFDDLLLALGAFIIIDYITSLFVAIVKRKWLPDNLGLKVYLEKLQFLFS